MTLMGRQLGGGLKEMSSTKGRGLDVHSRGGAKKRVEEEEKGCVRLQGWLVGFGAYARLEAVGESGPGSDCFVSSMSIRVCSAEGRGQDAVELVN